MTKIKIVENCLMRYLESVANSRRFMREYFNGQTVTFEDAATYARLKIGPTWRYEAALNACVDNTQEAINKYLEFDVKTDTLTFSPPSLVVYENPFSGTNQGPSGVTYRGTMTYNEPHTAVGTPAAGDGQIMQSGSAALSKHKTIKINV